MKLSAMSLPAFGMLQAGIARQPAKENNGTDKNSRYWNKGTRLTIAMWDFSWLTALRLTRSYLTTALNNMTFATGNRMQTVITESFGPCFWLDHPDVSWEWYKRYNGDAARVAASMPVEGISLSNYGEPIFTLWEDVDWHRNANLFILNV